jgi:hypothetical protein
VTAFNLSEKWEKLKIDTKKFFLPVYAQYRETAFTAAAQSPCFFMLVRHTFGLTHQGGPSLPDLHKTGSCDLTGADSIVRAVIFWKNLKFHASVFYSW